MHIFTRTPGEYPVVLAPMAGITDIIYREICMEHGCSLTYTEMVSAKGLYYGGSNTGALLATSQIERPCGVQIFGSDPRIMAEIAGRLCSEHKGNFALIDINMGCPVPKVTSNSEGSALMKKPALASRVIRAVSDASCLPVTVKFRKGWDENSVNAVEFARMAEESGASALTVHGRTRQQMYGGKADWDVIARVKQSVTIPVIGNGDVCSGIDALRMRDETGCDGIMIGRGAQGNPFIFEEARAALNNAPYSPPSDRERLDAAVEHVKRHVNKKGACALIQMRRHVAWYVRGMRGSAALREKVNHCDTQEEFIELIYRFKGELETN